MQTKFIFVVGGVISGVGKGVATASIGKILQNHGYDVTAVKIDPYINYDAGTLRPTEHGEVWVTPDGGEIDQDLGNYERFLGKPLSKERNITTGKVYKSIIDKERKGEYLGKTVQFIPHVPEEIKRRIKSAAKGNDIVMVEIGGTIGDYENIPFLFADKSLQRDLGKENVINVLVTYLPVPNKVGEMKTKPTQHAIKDLTDMGIFPDFILCRAEDRLDKVRKKKIETYANIDSDRVISAPDIDSIYSVPLNFEEEDLGVKILDSLDLDYKDPDWSEWSSLIDNLKDPDDSVKIGIVGKYLDIGDYELEDSYISISESIEHARAHLSVDVDVEWIDSKVFEEDDGSVSDLLDGLDGVIVPGGFGDSGIEGKINVINYCRENNIPFLGLCLGMQLGVIEFARNECGLPDAHSTEIDEDTPHPVIDIQSSQEDHLENNDYGGTMRLGSYSAILRPGTRTYDIYKSDSRISKDKRRAEELNNINLGDVEGKPFVLERHRHRYEVNQEYIDILEDNGLVFSGYHLREDGESLMEYIEVENHPFFIGTQSHPEFRSRLEEPSPLFKEFVKACLGNKNRVSEGKVEDSVKQRI